MKAVEEKESSAKSCNENSNEQSTCNQKVEATGAYGASWRRARRWQ